MTAVMFQAGFSVGTNWENVPLVQIGFQVCCGGVVCVHINIVSVTLKPFTPQHMTSLNPCSLKNAINMEY